VVYAETTRAGRKARGKRAVDLLIAATALSVGIPLYTANVNDFAGLEQLIELKTVARGLIP
jgi:predicted nucleic acid-binding protein